MTTQATPTFYQSLLAGGLAGTAVDLLFFPIDTVKTRLQSSQGFVHAGGFNGIYKGVGSVVVGSAPGAAVFFCTYDTLKRTLPFPSDLAPVTHMVSACVGEVAACLIRVPTEVIKTRMQTSTYGNLAQSSLAGAKRVLADEGIRGFYRGFGSTIMREIPFTSLQFPLYELLKSRLSSALGRKPLHAYEAAACGSLAGGVAAALTTPLDVLKTRVMLDMRGTSARDTNITATAPLKTDLAITASSAKADLRNRGHARVVRWRPTTDALDFGWGAVFLGVYEWAVNGFMDL